MIVGVPKEIKNNEYRVGLTPGNVLQLTHAGHEVFIESGAGSGVGFDNNAYQIAGARIVDGAVELFDSVEMIVKVKEPQASERQMLKSGQLLFTYLHLAPDLEQTIDLLESDAIAIAYETVTSRSGRLPLLAPMSEVAGRMSIQAAAHHLGKAQGGRGVLMAGIPGVEAANVLILGAGVVGTNALQMAVGLGANVWIVDQNVDRLRELDLIYGGRIKTYFSSPDVLTQLYPQMDVVIGGVLIPGGLAPHLLTVKHLETMKPGSVIVDVAIDQGGCFESSHPTSHENPTYRVNDIVHYCVANMPGAAPRTSTLGLTNATFPMIKQIADQGFVGAILENEYLKAGVSVYHGELCCQATAKSQNTNFKKIDQLIVKH